MYQWEPLTECYRMQFPIMEAMGNVCEDIFRAGTGFMIHSLSSVYLAIPI